MAEAAGETLGDALGKRDAVKGAVAEAGAVPLAVLYSDAGRVAAGDCEAVRLPEAQDEKVAAGSCEGLCAGVEVVQRVGEREEVGLWEEEEEKEEPKEPLGVALGHADADAGAVPVRTGLPEALAEDEATESCEGLCARVKVGQREGKGEDVGL